MTEERGEKPPLHFDAHEFDGLRQTLEEDVEGVLTTVDQYVRRNPWLALGVAAAAGFLIACAARKAVSKRSSA